MRNVSVTPFLGLEHDFGRLFDRFLAAAPSAGRSRRNLASGPQVRIDVTETEEAFVVRAEVPGIDPAELEINVQGDVLTLAGEKRAEEPEAEGRATYTERVYGAFRREIPLPTEVDSEAAEAQHSQGVVTIRLPKAAVARPRRIEVKGQ